MRDHGHIILTAIDQGDSAIAVLGLSADGNYQIKAVNGTYSRITGYAEAEAIGMTMEKLCFSATCMKTQKAIDNSMQSGQGLRGEIEYASRTGRPFWFGFTLMPVVDQATGRLNCVILARDITEKRRQDKEQSMMEALLASVFQKVDAAVMIVGPKGDILLANAMFQTITGFRTEELSRLNVGRLFLTEQKFDQSASLKQPSDPWEGRDADMVVIRKDGRHMPVRLKSVIVHRSDRQPLSVVTVHQLNRADPLQVSPTSQTEKVVVGSVQFIGLEAVRSALGSRWATLRDRLLLTAENILKRRLSDDDVFSRTADEGFSIWFKQGSEEENAGRIARIGREIRIMLLSELGEETKVAVRAYTDVAELDSSAGLQSATMAAVQQRLQARRQHIEEQAREFLDGVMKAQPSQSYDIQDNSGLPTLASFVDLPADMRGRFASAMSLIGGDTADLDAEVFRLSLAAAAIMDDVAEGRESPRLITMPFGIFMTRRGRDRLIEQFRGLHPSVRARLVIMLSELPSQINRARVADIADLLRSTIGGVGVILDEIEALPFAPPVIPFTIVGLASASVGAIPDVKLRAFMTKARQAKAKVLVRLSPTESPRRWQLLGAEMIGIF